MAHIRSYDADELRYQVSRIAAETRHGSVLGTVPQGTVQTADGREDDIGRVRYWTVWHHDFPIAGGFYKLVPSKAKQVLSLGAFVLPDWQRQGIYSAVLDLIEQVEGKPVTSDLEQTREAAAFWIKRGDPRRKRTTEGPKEHTDHVLGTGMTRLLQSMDDVKLRTDYSGRGMYGRTGLAIITGRSVLGLFSEILNELIAQDSHKDHYRALSLLMETAREDQLGHNTVVYFPGVTADLE